MHNLPSVNLAILITLAYNGDIFFFPPAVDHQCFIGCHLSQPQYASDPEFIPGILQSITGHHPHTHIWFGMIAFANMTFC